MKLVYLFSLGALLVASFTSSVQAAESPDTSELSRSASERLDAPRTSANSYLQDFGYGVILRIPNSTLSGFDLKGQTQPIKAKSVGMTFLYPDMTVSGSSSSMNTIFDKMRGIYVPQKDRFTVNILWMFYSPGELGNSPEWHEWQREPRPPRIELNRHCFEMIQGRCNFQMRRIPSGIAGVDAQVVDDRAKTHPEILLHNIEEGGSYIAKPESPYELVMSCDSFKGVQCLAHVYSKKHHFQYRMLFPPEAVAHTDDLIQAIDRMLDQWSSK